MGNPMGWRTKGIVPADCLPGDMNGERIIQSQAALGVRRHVHFAPATPQGFIADQGGSAQGKRQGGAS